MRRWTGLMLASECALIGLLNPATSFPAFAALARPAARISDPDYRSRGLNRTSSRLNRRIEARISHSSVGVGASLLDGGCNLLQVVGQTEGCSPLRDFFFFFFRRLGLGWTSNSAWLPRSMSWRNTLGIHGAWPTHRQKQKLLSVIAFKMEHIHSMSIWIRSKANNAHVKTSG